MRLHIVTDFDEFCPDLATIDIIWDPPWQITERWLPMHDPRYGLILQPQIFVDMQDPLDPGGVRPMPVA